MIAREYEDTYEEMENLIREIRKLVTEENYIAADREASLYMSKYPHSAIPHNLMGIIMEMKEDHIGAMKHFRAAWALDPAYAPARENMNQYGTFDGHYQAIYDESDCQKNMHEKIKYKVKYDENGVGHMERA